MNVSLRVVISADVRMAARVDVRTDGQKVGHLYHIQQKKAQQRILQMQTVFNYALQTGPFEKLLDDSNITDFICYFFFPNALLSNGNE